MHTKGKESRLRTDGGRAARALLARRPPRCMPRRLSCRRRKEARASRAEERCRRLPPASRSAPRRRPRPARLRAVLTGPLYVDRGGAALLPLDGARRALRSGRWFPAPGGAIESRSEGPRPRGGGEPARCGPSISPNLANLGQSRPVFSANLGPLSTQSRRDPLAPPSASLSAPSRLALASLRSFCTFFIW